MDVNETLRKLRQAVVAWDDAAGDSETAAVADDMVEHFRALDEWLSKGRFLPDDWNKGRLTLKRGE